MSLEKDLLKIEEAMWNGGPEAYEKHLDRECLVAFTEGAGLMPKDDIASRAEKGRWRDVSLHKKGIAELSPGTAVVTYECHAKRNTGEDYHALVSSAYVKRGKDWKLAFHQQTPLYEPMKM